MLFDIFFCPKTIQNIIGTPRMAVTELIGKTISELGTCAIKSLNNIKLIPIKIEAGKSTFELAVLNQIRQRWGTTMPINPIGPQKAVIQTTLG